MEKLFTINWLRQSVLILGLMLLFGIYAIHLGQDASWDLKNYHFYDAYAFLQHRLGWDIAPALFHTFYNPLLELPNYFIIKLAHSGRWVEFILGTFHGIAVYFFLRIAFLIFANEKSWLRYCYVFFAVLLGVTGAASIPQIGTTHNESQISIFICAAVFLALKFIHGDHSKRYYWCLLSGLILGLGVGLKLTAMIYPLAFFAALLFYKKADLQQLKWIFLTGIVFCLGFLFTGGEWMWVLYKSFHNPLFPYYNKIFNPGGISYNDLFDVHFLPKSFLFALLEPFYWLRKTTLVEFYPTADARVAVTFVLGLLFACQLGYAKLFPHRGFFAEEKRIFAVQTNTSTSLRKEILSVRFIGWFFFVAYFTWIFLFAIYRYTIPLNFLSGMLIVYFCVRLVRAPLLRVAILLILSLTILHFTVYPRAERIAYHKHFFTVSIPSIPKNAMVILVGASPVGYLIPFFPADTRFVALDTYFVNSRNPVFLQQALTAIKNQQGPLYVLVDPIDPTGSSVDFKNRQKTILKSYNLLLSDQKCAAIISNMDKPIPLCVVNKLSVRGA